MPREAIRSLEAFLRMAPNDPAAPQVQAEIYALEVEAERTAAAEKWKGLWLLGTDRYRIIREGSEINLIYLEGASQNRRPGDVVRYGTVSGTQFQGNQVIRPTNSNEIRCFGGEYKTTARGELSADGYTITFYRSRFHYLFESCEKTEHWEDSVVYKRLP